MSDKPLVYLILGAAGSGRREVLADLIANGLADGEPAATLLAEGEAPAPEDARLGMLARWRLRDGAIEADLPTANRVFLLADGRRNPVDQVEALKPWLDAAGGELARICCVVHCGLAAAHPPLLAWYDACVHFADVVLLNRREGVANKWLSDFQARYANQFYPCLIEPVKAGRVKNPALLLEPQARRVSHYFDETDWDIPDEEDDEADGGEVELRPEVDVYLARRQGGRREKEIPDIAKFLDSGPAAG